MFMVKNRFPQIAVITYNDFRFYTNGIHTIEGVSVLVAGKTFSTKKKEDVTAEDINFKYICTFKDTLVYVLVFIGKVSSASLEIISICIKIFGRERCVFVSCDHDHEEKIEHLHRYYFDLTHFFEFQDPRLLEDSTLRCDEGPVLLEVLKEYIARIYIKKLFYL
jgi:hypothetical protein